MKNFWDKFLKKKTGWIPEKNMAGWGNHCLEEPLEKKKEISIEFHGGIPRKIHREISEIISC